MIGPYSIYSALVCFKLLVPFFTLKYLKCTLFQLCGKEYQQLCILYSDYESSEGLCELSLINHHHLCHFCISIYDVCLTTFTSFTLNILQYCCKLFNCLNTRKMKCTVLHNVMAPRPGICLPYLF